MELNRIIIVDDEHKMVSLVRQFLITAGYEVVVANRGERAIQIVAEEQFDLMILEVALSGGIDGFEVVRSIREYSEMPIIILTTRTSPEDMLRGFDLGVDDYITKPFNAKILLARLRAVLKRCQRIATDPVEIICKNLTINLPRRRVTKDGVEIYLTQTEYNLLVELARHPNQVLMHEQLLSAVWGKNFQNEVDYLRSYIHILRRKLEDSPSNPKMILSKPGVGYVLVVP